MNNLIQKFKRLFKKIFGNSYKKVILYLRRDLGTDEIQRLTHHIIAQLEIIKKEQSDLKKQINICNVFLAGIPNNKNELYQKINISAEEMNEALKSINNSHSDIFAINYMKIINKIGLKNKTVLLIGANNNLYTLALIKSGVKSVERIEAAPYYNNKTKNDDVTYIFPTRIDQLKLDYYDILIIPDKFFCSLIIKNNLTFLGAKIKEKAILNLDIQNFSVNENVAEPEVFIDKDNNLLSFNDNYARKKIHAGGFFEVSCLYTYGRNINNNFDKKITQFNYIKGYKLIHRIKSKSANIDGFSEKIYIAYKLPQTTS